VVGGVVVVEVALPVARNLAKNPDVRVAHDRDPPGLGTGIETATAWGQLVWKVLGSDESEAERALQAGDELRRLAAFGASNQARPRCGSEPQPAG
jgi:hypothetical protein